MFIVTFHNAPLKFSELANYPRADVCERAEATVFASEADAWGRAARQKLLPIEAVEVINLNEQLL